MNCAIIGAGLAGLTCADELTAAGHTAVLFDKGRGPGGRMSTRRMETAYGTVRVDHGAQCLHASDPVFKKVVARWHAAGLVAPWPAAGPSAWTGVPGMSAVVAHIAARHQVSWGTFVQGIMRDRDGAWRVSCDGDLRGPFDAIVLAMPAEQTVPVLSLYDLNLARIASQARSRPCWAGLMVFAEELPVPALPIRDTGILAHAVPNRAKPGRTGPEAWIVQATAEWSVAHLEESAPSIAPRLLEALREALSLPDLPPSEVVAHRWRYAGADGVGRPALWNPALRLGACGDWMMGPWAENAWKSGRELAGMITALPAFRETSVAQAGE